MLPDVQLTAHEPLTRQLSLKLKSLNHCPVKRNSILLILMTDRLVSQNKVEIFICLVYCLRQYPKLRDRHRFESVL
jgi:hypothetical protein